MGVPGRDLWDSLYDDSTGVPEREAWEHDIQRQDKRYIAALAPSIVFPCRMNIPLSTSWLPYEFTLIVARLTHLRCPVVVIRLHGRKRHKAS